MVITTRTRAMMLAILIGVVFFVFQSVNFLEIFDLEFEFDFIQMTILSVITYIGVFWVVNFKVRGERFLTVLLFPSLAVFILTLYINLLIGSLLSDVDRIVSEVVASIVITIFAYILILTANILNIGFLQKIPLTQAGRAAHYVLTLFVAYLFFSMLFSNTIPFVVKILSTGVIAYLFSIIALWNIEIKYYQRFVASVGIGLMMVVGAFVLTMWPVASEYIALILSLVFYMALGLALEVREVLKVRVWFEYSLLYFSVVLILLLVSNWGINGTLI